MINLESIFKNNAERIAYVIDNDSITYGKLWEKANRYADLLKRQGNEPVIIYGHKSIYMIISILACLIAKRAYVPVDISVPKRRLLSIIEKSKASLIIKNEELDVDFLCLRLDELDKYSSDNYVKNNNDIAYIIFTSGSTGEPKGVRITYSNLNNFINWISNLYFLKDYHNIKVLNQANFNFDLSVADIFYSLFNGHTLVGLNKSFNEFDEMFKVIKDVNLMVITPTFMSLCLVNKDFNEANYPNLDGLYFCGERLDVSLVKKIYERFTSIKIINAYGPTEATSAVSGIVIDKSMLVKELLPVGTISKAATDITIINNEIVLSGKSVFKGYIGYDNNGIYYTGDIGYIEEDYLYCKGRIDNQIKYKGYRIELEEIENVLKSINGVRECVVIPNYLNNKVSSLKAIVESDNEIDLREVEDKLPNYMIPSKIIKVDKLPINNNGKIDREKVKELW